MNATLTPQDILDHAEALRPQLSSGFRDEIVKSLYSEVERIHPPRCANGYGTQVGPRPAHRPAGDFHQFLGCPSCCCYLAAAVLGNHHRGQRAFGPDRQGAVLRRGPAAALFTQWGLPWWVTGFIWHGVYRGLAWVISVMLPPMAIFFPIFTILEDLGYLPRVAFNLDWLFKRAGAHGKQSLTMAMGFGCNAAGVIATRVIDSPRERLIAILTNNFVPCNGRFPTLIMLATVFVAASFPPAVASCPPPGRGGGGVGGSSFHPAGLVALSKTQLKGEASAFTLEMPPYRRPNVGRILYTSLIDRTIFVLVARHANRCPRTGPSSGFGATSPWEPQPGAARRQLPQPNRRAVGPGRSDIAGQHHCHSANEIVVPTMMMVYMGVGAMTDIPELGALRTLLIDGHGWTLLTAINLMLFSLLHNPCATTITTIYKETKSYKWAILSVVITLGLAFLVTFTTASVARLLGVG